MNQTYYHATNFDNLVSILDNGLKPNNIEHLTYLCKKPEHCLRFHAIRGSNDVLVLKVKLNSTDVFETFDHSYEFFKCKCFGTNKRITSKDIVEYTRYRV